MTLDSRQTKPWVVIQQLERLLGEKAKRGTLYAPQIVREVVGGTCGRAVIEVSFAPCHPRLRDGYLIKVTVCWGRLHKGECSVLEAVATARVLQEAATLAHRCHELTLGIHPWTEEQMKGAWAALLRVREASD